MAKVHKFRFSPARGVEIANRTVGELQEKGVIMRTGKGYSGRYVEVDGRMMQNFGSCSYMGLERRRELREGCAAATREYGSQFPFSRAYLQCGLYQTLEEHLEQMTQRPVVVAASTTLAHIAALPVLIKDNDAVLIDQFAHASLHTAAELLRDVPVRTVRHGRLDQIAQLAGELSSEYERVWLIIDGVYSMLGELAPYVELSDLLDRYPKLHLYIDDAHATGWLGRYGRGGALTRLGHHDRVVVALSLNKSFAAAGGALALPDPELKIRIRRCGGPMLFSGPIQPPMLGAAVASAEIHLTREHAERQEELLLRIDYALAAAESFGIPLETRDRTPIFFIRRDSPGEVVDAVLRFWELGFYVCPTTFPAVPVNWPGIRFTVTMHNEKDDIAAFMEAARLVCCATADPDRRMARQICHQV